MVSGGLLGISLVMSDGIGEVNISSFLSSVYAKIDNMGNDGS